MESKYITDNPFYLLFQLPVVDLSLLVEQMKLGVDVDSSPLFLESFLLYSIRYKNGKEILHFLLPFYFSHFSISIPFIKDLLFGESSLSTQKSVVAPILSSCLMDASSAERTNCLLYSVLLTIQSHGDICSICRSVEYSFKQHLVVDDHSVFLCCCFFNETPLSPIQTHFCSSLLSLVITRWLDQNQHPSKELLSFVLSFVSIGQQEALLHRILERLVTAENAKPTTSEAFCKEERILSTFCYNRDYHSFIAQSHFLMYTFLFSTKKEEVLFCLNALPTIQDVYSVQFTLFLYG